MLKNNFHKAFICLVVSTVLLSCSTKKNKFVNRTYHNITARYNGYFYADESIKDGVEKIEKAHQEDYTKILPVFIYASAATAKNIYPEMDRAIKKSSKVIQRHTITDRHEHEIIGAVKWTDENYLTIGKAHFYKHDFFSALEALEYVAEAYTESPNRYLARMWMIRCYNEIGSFTKSQALIDFLNNEKEFPKNFNSEFAAIVADYYLKRENYDNAIVYLSKAASKVKKKKVRVRYAYILAQLYEEIGDLKNARGYYRRVINLKPKYEMVFNARMKLARLFDIDSGDSKEIKKVLTKMLKDAKNIDYLDQIYYALAEIEEKEKNTKGTIKYLKLSVKNSISNNNQKALSYLKLGDIHFEIPDYKNAASFYDSTMIFLSQDYPNYKKIKEKKENLSSLINSINTVSVQDSLQQLALMSEADRNKVIEKKIAMVKAEEERKKREAEEQKISDDNALFTASRTNNNTTGFGGNKWYFYNPSTVSFGVGEFTRVWGNRKLEDNWRRSNKATIEAFYTEENTSTTTTASTGAVNEKMSKEYYLKGIPFSKEAKTISDSLIIEAYYNMGTIYKEQLKDYNKSAESYEELLRRYAVNKYQLSSYYILYRVYTKLKNSDKATYYKNKLLKDHPESEYARILENPEYYNQIAAKKGVVESYYTNTYNLYAAGDYAAALSRCKAADSLYSESEYAPQFSYLKALSIGRTQGIDAFEAALASVSLKHPKHPVSKEAEAMLATVKQQKAGVVTNKKGENKATYNHDTKGNFIWLVLVDSKQNKLDKFRIALSNYHTKFLSLASLNITSTFLNDSTSMVTVKLFDSLEKAKEYYKMLSNNEEVFKNLKKETFNYFFISENNFATLFKEKDATAYRKFFKEKYLTD